jgi:cytolysin (calcineurin-like family phosphatase)
VVVLLLVVLGRLQATDLTFLTCSDTHYRQVAATNATQAAIIDMMNALPGKQYPASVGGGVVAVPRGVIVPGDLVDTGQGPANLVKQQWSLWVADFGLKGEGRLRFPVYEGYGNHELNGNLLIENCIKERNLARSNVVAIATNGFHYAWEWDGIHFVQLNLYPGNARPKGQPPRYALDFLRDDLKKNVAGSRRPIVISHHYVPTDTWWSQEEKNAYFDAIKEYNVILIIVGDQFRASVIDWQGLTVLDNNHFRLSVVA